MERDDFATTTHWADRMMSKSVLPSHSHLSRVEQDGETLWLIVRSVMYFLHHSIVFFSDRLPAQFPGESSGYDCRRRIVHSFAYRNKVWSNGVLVRSPPYKYQSDFHCENSRDEHRCDTGTRNGLAVDLSSFCLVKAIGEQLH